MTIRVRTIEVYRYQHALLKLGRRVFYADAAQEIRQAKSRRASKRAGE